MNHQPVAGCGNERLEKVAQARSYTLLLPVQIFHETNKDVQALIEAGRMHYALLCTGIAESHKCTGCSNPFNPGSRNLRVPGSITLPSSAPFQSGRVILPVFSSDYECQQIVEIHETSALLVQLDVEAFSGRWPRTGDGVVAFVCDYERIMARSHGEIILSCGLILMRYMPTMIWQ